MDTFINQDNLLRNCFVIAALVFSIHSFSQTNADSTFNKIDPQKWASVVQKRTQKLEEKLVQKTIKTIDKLQRQEEKIYKKLLDTKDSLAAKQKLAEIRNSYAALKEKFESTGQTPVRSYIPRLDTLNTAFKFLSENGLSEKVKVAFSKTTALQNQFQKAEEIKKFIKERKEQLKVHLEKLGMVRELKKINKEVYYYAAQIKEYKNILNDPKKIEKKAIELLSRTKVFQDFMKKNSLLASLFRMPGDASDPAYVASLSGLQTRAQVNALIQQQIASGGPGAQQQFQQNLQAAQSQLNQLKNKVLKFGGNSSEDIMPDGFKPNSQKTKAFLKRLEIGTNLQSQSARNYFPVTTDLGLSLGYKLNDKSILGIGASYKLGWGRGWDNIHLSHEGIGLRSFIDWKIKNAFWVSGGYELNYRTAFNSISQLRNLAAWQQSGLLGISKSLPIKTKFFKKTKLQLLWDLLSYEQVPRTQPIVFRIGYGFN